MDPDGLAVAEAGVLGDEVPVADCDLDLCHLGKEEMFDFAAHRQALTTAPSLHALA